MAELVEIFEVGPRDGLQNEKRPITLDEKLRLVDLLSDVGFRRIEVAAFVSPKWVPQMADSDRVLARIRRAAGVRYAALVPNLRGFEGALAARADEVAIFASASEGFSRANINCSIAESLARFVPVAQAAKRANLPLRGYVSCVTDCPYDGPTDPGAVARVVSALGAMGCYEISLGDTIGQGTPERVSAMLKSVLEVLPARRLAGHFHDTRARALANIDASLALGLRVFDAAAGGLGGCPYAPGAAGNVASEVVAKHLKDLGYDTGLAIGALEKAARFAQSLGTQGDSNV